MLGRTNAGGGGVGGVLTVTAPAGVTVTISKDGKVKTKTANAEGVAVFKGLATGTWTLTITDGVQTSTKSVEITADYSAVIAFFAATINITYPSGSTCTCTDGATTLKAPDTSGKWACIVHNAGTWTVTSTDGTNTKSYAVSITTDGQSESVVLAYWNGELYDAGNEFEHITGGWVAENCDSQYTASGGGLSKTDEYMVAWIVSYASTSAITVNQIDLTKYKKLHLTYTGGSNYSKLMIAQSFPTNPSNYIASRNLPSVSAKTTVSLDISNINIPARIAIGQQTNIYKVWLE